MNQSRLNIQEIAMPSAAAPVAAAAAPTDEPAEVGPTRFISAHSISETYSRRSQKRRPYSTLHWNPSMPGPSPRLFEK